MQCGVVRTSSVAALAVALLGAVTSRAKAQATDSTKAPAYGSTAKPDATVARTFGGFVQYNPSAAGSLRRCTRSGRRRTKGRPTTEPPVGGA